MLIQEGGAELTLNRISDFFSTEPMINLGETIESKKPYFRVIFKIIGILGTSLVGTSLLIITGLLFYPNFRKPTGKSTIFQLGLSINNKRVFENVNEVLNIEAPKSIVLNGPPISLIDKIKMVLSSPQYIWKMAKLFKKLKHENSFVQTQQLLGSIAYVIYEWAFYRELPDIVCIANDHSPICMALIDCAHKHKISTCYMQHAPVTKYFPPLNFDLSVLFDQCSLEIYENSMLPKRSVNRGSITFLSPFVSEFKQPRMNPPPYKVGICLSLVTNFDALHNLVNEILEHKNVSFIFLRPHPRCKLNYSFFEKKSKVSVCSEIELPSQFFERVDIILVPNSGIAIESLHSGKVTYYEEEIDNIASADHYGFVEARILQKFKISYLDDIYSNISFFDQEWKNRYSRYDLTISTSFETMKENVAYCFDAL